MVKRLAVLVLAVPLGACGAGLVHDPIASGSLDYAVREYGHAARDGTVHVPHGDKPLTFFVWLHKTKPKIMVVSQTESGIGPNSDMQSQVYFEKAAVTFLEDRGRRCQVSGTNRIQGNVYDFDLNCGQPAPVAATPVRPKR